MQWIVDQLFVGNRLATGEIVTSDGDRIDLRNIRSPIVCFCSKGDNITPPQQALGWIIDLYGSDDDLRASGQTIVYAVHETIGHLGIFVSGGVAKKEHEEFASNIDLIDVLPPGLYEAVLTPKRPTRRNPELVTATGSSASSRARSTTSAPSCSPTPRTSAASPPSARLRDQPGLYRTLFQPFVQAFGATQVADGCTSSSLRLPFELFSRAQPADAAGRPAGRQVREQRRPAAPDNPLLQWQAMCRRHGRCTGRLARPA